MLSRGRLAAGGWRHTPPCVLGSRRHGPRDWPTAAARPV